MAQGFVNTGYSSSGGDGFRGFRASRSTAQTITTSTSTKIQLNTEEYDTNGEYDPTTNYRHTPTAAGKWLYIGTGSVVLLADGAALNVKIYKNGSAVNESKYPASASMSVWGSSTTILDMNGTTDYVELYLSHNHGSNRDTDAFASVNWLTGVYLGA